MKANRLYLMFLVLLQVMFTSACSKDDEGLPEKERPIDQGVLYYSAAGELIRYDFSSKKRVSLFSGGDHYSVSQDAKRFIWYKNNFGDGTTSVQVHNSSNPSEYQLITLPYILDQTPKFIPGSENQYVALARAADGAVKRQDLVLFSSDDEVVSGRIPHVKAFAISPNAQDLIISAEAFSPSGEHMGYALAVIKNFRSSSGQESFTISEYPDYETLPEDIAVSANGQELVFTQLDHLYTISIVEDAKPIQITQSRFREVDAAWSKDGNYIIFTANVSNPALDCGEIRIIAAHPGSAVPIPEDEVNNEPVDELQPIDTKGKTIHACGSESYLWL